MSQQIAPGDLVRVVKSHCAAAWEHEAGKYFVAVTGAYKLHPKDFIRCDLCGEEFSHGDTVVVTERCPGRDGGHPAAWLRKVPPLTEGEIAEDCAQDLDQLEHTPLRDSQPEAAS